MNNAFLFYMHSHEAYSSCGLSIVSTKTYDDDDDVQEAKIRKKSTLCIFQRKNTRTQPTVSNLLIFVYSMTKGNKRFGNIMHNHDTFYHGN
jgi:hypothetical protein